MIWLNIVSLVAWCGFAASSWLRIRALTNLGLRWRQIATRLYENDADMICVCDACKVARTAKAGARGDYYRERLDEVRR